MTSARKVYLVDSIRYKNLIDGSSAEKSHPEVQTPSTNSSPFTHPNVEAVHTLTGEMKEVLNDNELTDFEKVERYNSKLTSYLHNFRAAIVTTPSDALIGPVDRETRVLKMSKSEEVPDLDAFTDEAIISSVPKTYRKRAEALLNSMSMNTKIAWDQDGVISYGGKPVSGTNIITLLNDMVRRGRVRTSSGAFDQFISLLETENIPVTHRFVNKESKKVSERDETRALTNPETIRRTLGVRSKVTGIKSSGRVLKSWKPYEKR